MHHRDRGKFTADKKAKPCYERYPKDFLKSTLDLHNRSLAIARSITPEDVKAAGGIIPLAVERGISAGVLKSVIEASGAPL